MSSPTKNLPTRVGTERCAPSASASTPHAEWLTVLPVLAGQLEAAARDMEGQVAHVCESFQAIAHRARECADRNLMLCGAQDSGVSQEQGLKSILASARFFAERIAQFDFDQVTARIGRIRHQMVGVGEVLENIDAIAAQIRLLGFNVAIEAARAGNDAQTFHVVAAETRSLAQHVAHTSRTLAHTVRDLVENVSRVAEEVQAASMIGRELGSLYAGMERASAQLAAAAVDSAQVGQELTRRLSQAIVALQFQDRVKQQISHVVEVLRDIHATASAPGESPGQGQGGREWDTRVRQRYTMEQERVIHGGLAHGPVPPGPCLGTNVELF